MIDRILGKFGYIQKKETEAEILALKAKVIAFETEERSKRPFINVGLKDPIFGDTDRKTYVARAAAFHKEVLGPKLLVMIGNVREQLEKFDSAKDNLGRPITSFDNETFDAVLRGTSNAFWLIYDWGESMINEQIAYQTQGLSDEEKKKLQEELNK